MNIIFQFQDNKLNCSFFKKKTLAVRHTLNLPRTRSNFKSRNLHLLLGWIVGVLFRPEGPFRLLRRLFREAADAVGRGSNRFFFFLLGSSLSLAPSFPPEGAFPPIPVGIPWPILADYCSRQIEKPFIALEPTNYDDPAFGLLLYSCIYLLLYSVFPLPGPRLVCALPILGKRREEALLP